MKPAAWGLLLLLEAASCGGSARSEKASSSAPEQPPIPSSASMAAEASRQTEMGAAAKSAASTECVMRYPAQQPFDVGDVPIQSVPGMTGPASVPSVEPIVQECRAHGGLQCDPERFISKQAALCIAQTWEPAEVGSWSTELLFRTDDPDARVQWLVLAMGQQGADCCGPSWSFWIDATSAETLSHSGPLEACCALQ
jgi:hypothetical protein